MGEIAMLPLPFLAQGPSNGPGAPRSVLQVWETVPWALGAPCGAPRLSPRPAALPLADWKAGGPRRGPLTAPDLPGNSAAPVWCDHISHGRDWSGFGACDFNRLRFYAIISRAGVIDPSFGASDLPWLLFYVIISHTGVIDSVLPLFYVITSHTGAIDLVLGPGTLSAPRFSVIISRIGEIDLWGYIPRRSDWPRPLFSTLFFIR